MIKRLLLLLIRFYRRFLSPMHAPCCPFTPTCSTYAMKAIEEHGALKGGYLAVRRLLRCQPFYKGSFFLALLLHKCTKTGILINKYNFREALPMKADKYRFDGARTCDLRALSCDDKEDAPDKDEIPAKTAEKLQKMTALEAER